MRTKGVCGLSVDGGAGASKFSSAQRWGGACCVDCYAEMFTFGCLLLAVYFWLRGGFIFHALPFGEYV